MHELPVRPERDWAGLTFAMIRHEPIRDVIPLRNLNLDEIRLPSPPALTPSSIQTSNADID